MVIQHVSGVMVYRSDATISASHASPLPKSHPSSNRQEFVSSAISEAALERPVRSGVLRPGNLLEAGQGWEAEGMRAAAQGSDLWWRLASAKKQGSSQCGVRQKRTNGSSRVVQDLLPSGRHSPGVLIQFECHACTCGGLLRLFRMRPPASL